MLIPAFSRACAKPQKLTNVDFFEAILKDRPDFNESRAYFPMQGNSSHTIIIGEEVFKAPRNVNVSGAENTVDKIEKEAKILRHLQGIGLPVPEFTCEGKETVFIGMTLMKGVKLYPVVIERMNKQEKRKLAKDIVGFIAGFENAISAQDAKLLGFPKDAWTAFEMKPEDSQRALSNPAVIKALGNHADFCRDMQAAFVKIYEKKYRNVPQVASHCDLHFGNILYDPKENMLSAVIDFGEAGFTRPERNFVAFLRQYKDDFASMICKEYSKKSGNKVILKDVRAFLSLNWVLILSQRLKVGDEKEAQFAKEQISKLKEILSPIAEKKHVAAAVKHCHI